MFSQAIITGFSSASVACLVFVSSFAVYRICLHPLSRFPGPRLAAVSDWYAAYFASSGKLHWKIHGWHKQYGPVVRIGPNLVILNDFESFKQLYGPNPQLEKSTKRYAAVSASHHPNLVTDNQQPRVNLKRKAHLNMWNEGSLKYAEPRFHVLIARFLSLLGPGDVADQATNSWGKTHNLSEVTSWFGYDTTISMATGGNPDLMSSPEKRWLPITSVSLSWRALVSSFQPKLHLWNLDKMIFGPIYKRIIELGSYYWHETQTRASRGVIGSQDLVEVMMQTKDAKRNLEFSKKELWLEVVLMGGVGTTTIGPQLSSVLSFLLHSPEKLDRLVRELDENLDSEGDICIGEKLKSCEYLWACADEIFRLMPTIQNALFRTVHRGGVVINGMCFEEGTELGASIFEIHRNDQYFVDPHEFQPERYLGSESERAEAKKYWVPFSRGNRSCVGQSLVYTIMTQTLASIVWRYDLRLAPESCCGSKPTYQPDAHHEFQSFVGLKTDGPLVQVKDRRRLRPEL